MGGYDSFIDDDEEDTSKSKPNDEENQGLPDTPEIDEIIYNIDKEREANSYELYIEAEVVLPDWKGKKKKEKYRKQIKYDNIIT